METAPALRGVSRFPGDEPKRNADAMLCTTQLTPQPKRSTNPSTHSGAHRTTGKTHLGHLQRICQRPDCSTEGGIEAIKTMKKGANTDRSELKIGSYKLLTDDERLLAPNQKFFMESQ